MVRRLDHAALPERGETPITEYALVGDGHSAALVSAHGDVDLWSPRRFDADPVFLRLLDENGGSFRTAPAVSHRVEVGYLPRSNVHHTRFVTPNAELISTTFMPYSEAHHRDDARQIIRILEATDRPVAFTLDFLPRFDHGRTAPIIEQTDGIHARHPAEEDSPTARQVTLQSTLPLAASENGVQATYAIEPGERHAIVVTDRTETLRGDLVAYAETALVRELAYWNTWLGRCTYDGPYQDAVERSLLALKLLEYTPTGGFVAAPTFGLPERPGGTENWDYRYTWLRDSAFIVMAFETMGYKDEAVRFRRWLARVVKRDAPDRLRPVYRVDGTPLDDEQDLPQLSGYRGGRPVRVGNRATAQKQLDAYGEIMICFHRAPVLWQEEGEALWRALAQLTDAALDHWQERDAGIWETADEHDYTFSKGMVWLALDRAIEIARKQGFDGSTSHWQAGKDVIRRWMDENAKDADGAWMQAPGRDPTDAALLLFPLFGITEPDHPSVGPTLSRTQTELVSHGYAHRILLDSKRGSEGGFLAVNFWLAHNLAQRGQVDDARAYFEAAWRTASVLGLLPEEADPVTRTALGNYPLGLSHYSLLLAAYAIDEAER